MNKLFCSYKFKDDKCQYSGRAKKCDKTIKRCKELNNINNFGNWGIGVKEVNPSEKVVAEIIKKEILRVQERIAKKIAAHYAKIFAGGCK